MNDPGKKIQTLRERLEVLYKEAELLREEIKQEKQYCPDKRKTRFQTEERMARNIDIIRRRGEGESLSSLSRCFDLSRQTIKTICDVATKKDKANRAPVDLAAVREADKARRKGRER